MSGLSTELRNKGKLVTVKRFEYTRFERLPLVRANQLLAAGCKW